MVDTKRRTGKDGMKVEAAQSVGRQTHQDSAEGGAGTLHKITKPFLWRRGPQIIGHVFEDAQFLKGVRGSEETRIEEQLASR